MNLSLAFVGLLLTLLESPSGSFFFYCFFSFFHLKTRSTCAEFNVIQHILTGCKHKRPAVRARCVSYLELYLAAIGTPTAATAAAAAAEISAADGLLLPVVGVSQVSVQVWDCRVLISFSHF
jgi:hypothetical protein